MEPKTAPECIIRPTTVQDVDAALQLFCAARAYFKQNGIDQWQDGYPDRAAVLRDIACGASYLVQQQDRIVATFMAAVCEDGNYKTTYGGAWRTSGTPYAVLHRIAVDDACKGQGIGARVVDFIAHEIAPQAPIPAASIRGDTHADNASMRRMLLRTGFTPCGVILLEDGAPRDAFELVL